MSSSCWAAKYFQLPCEPLALVNQTSDAKAVHSHCICVGNGAVARLSAIQEADQVISMLPCVHARYRQEGSAVSSCIVEHNPPDTIACIAWVVAGATAYNTVALHVMNDCM